MADEVALQALIDQALETFNGSGQVGRAKQYLETELQAGRFNTERAAEVFRIAIDNATWGVVKSIPMSSTIYRDYKASGLSAVYAARLTDQFKKQTGATDQRPARRFLRGIFGA